MSRNVAPPAARSRRDPDRETELSRRAKEVRRQLERCERTLEYYAPLARARDFVEQRLPETVTAEAAAAVAHLERHYFSAYFRERVGVTFSEWLNLVRLARALALLQQRDWNVPELAEAAGFVSPRNLQRTFRRYLGATPTQARELARGGLRSV